MKVKLLAMLAVVSVLLCANRAVAAETNTTATTELQTLISKVKAKLAAGTQTEANLAPELKEFDALLAKHKGEKTDDVAEILGMKAQLYLEVLNDNIEGAVQPLKQLKQDFPATKRGQWAAQLLPEVERTVEAAKIRRSLVLGAKFPNFNENDSTGKPLSLTNYTGKVVLLDFWATWCMPCILELPSLLKAYEAHHAQGFEIIGISLDDNAQRFTSVIKAKNLPWPQHFDGLGTQNKLAVKYGVIKVPTNYLLDREGIIIGIDLRGEETEQAVAKALAKK